MLILIFHFLIVQFLFSQEAHVRLHLEELNHQTVAAQIFLKSSNNTFVLGNQNFRVFYNSDKLTLKNSAIASHLDGSLYTNPSIIEHDIYDQSFNHPALGSIDQFGMINFNVMLRSDRHGGQSINNSWELMYTLYFDNPGDIEFSDIIIAHPHKTQDIATAFTEMSEWTHPNSTKPLRIIIDEARALETPLTVADLTVGPNPSIDYFIIRSSVELVNVNIYTASGRLLEAHRLYGSEERIGVNHLIAGMYILELEDETGSISIKEIIKS